MPKFPIFSVLLAFAMAWPSLGLELADLRLPLTRDEADKALSRDYSFRVLEDMTIRRTWELQNRTVSVDFSPKAGDKALLIFIDYRRPVSPDEAAEDAAKLMNVSQGKWQKLNEQRALRLGMEAAEGFKLAGGRYCFRELNEKGRIVRLAYYADVPKEVRWDIPDDVRNSGKTAMGSQSSGSASEVIWRDEERRRGVSANSSEASLASAAAAVVADGAPATPPASKKKKAKPADEPFDLVFTVEEFVKNMTPQHYAIGGGVLALLLLWRWVANARAAKRRALAAQYILAHGPIHVKGARGKARR